MNSSLNEVVTDISLGGDQSVSTVGSSVYNSSFRMNAANPNATDFAMGEKGNDDDDADEADRDGTQDPATREAEEAIAREREEMYKQNAAKLQDVLAVRSRSLVSFPFRVALTRTRVRRASQSIKNSTKTVLSVSACPIGSFLL